MDLTVKAGVKGFLGVLIYAIPSVFQAALFPPGSDWWATLPPSRHTDCRAPAGSSIGACPGRAAETPARCWSRLASRMPTCNPWSAGTRWSRHSRLRPVWSPHLVCKSFFVRRGGISPPLIRGTIGRVSSEIGLGEPTPHAGTNRVRRTPDVRLNFVI